MHKERWLLPDGIDEMLPPAARRIEGLRRHILDLFDSWGYELVIPPLIEYLESLLTGTGSDLDLQTFKLIDQLTGRTLGLRADITPQVARMDAHRLRRDTPTRLCYLGTVLHTRDDGFAGSRSPLQIGAELFGHAGVESDMEVLRLMWRTLELAGLTDIHLDLGHVGIFRGLARRAGLDPDQELELFDALQRKASGEIAAMVEGFGVAPGPARMLLGLSQLDGEDALARGREVLKGADGVVAGALEHLERLASGLADFLPGVPVHFDLAELRGYHYKTGVVFAAFVPGSGQEVARGGRYDAIGRVFGRARPAVGFSADLKTLLRFGRGPEGRRGAGATLAAPWGQDPGLQKTVESLRNDGNRVITLLPGQEGDAAAMGCSGILVQGSGGWRVQPTEG